MQPIIKIVNYSISFLHLCFYFTWFRFTSSVTHDCLLKLQVILLTLYYTTSTLAITFQSILTPNSLVSWINFVVNPKTISLFEWQSVETMCRVFQVVVTLDQDANFNTLILLINSLLWTLEIDSLLYPIIHQQQHHQQQPPPLQPKNKTQTCKSMFIYLKAASYK